MIRLIRKPFSHWTGYSPGRYSIHREAVGNSENTYPSPENFLQITRRNYRSSHLVLQPKDKLHVTVEQSHTSQTSSTKDNKCGPIEENYEMEQEEMFVTSDPVLGLGKIQEWGGPRRGGRLAEPTRFGDWERKGRCTDF